MTMIETLAYLMPLCLFIGTTTALTKSEEPVKIILQSIRFTLSLALGVMTLGAALVILNLII